MADMAMGADSSNMPLATTGSGNVFVDMDLPNADQELVKARLTFQIHTLLKERNFTPAGAATLLGIMEPQASALIRNRSNGFPVGRLIEFLTALGQDVEITITPTRKEHGEMSLVFA